MYAAMRGYRFRVSVLVLLALLTGCSALSLAWSYVDGAVADRVDDWTALEPSQRAALERRLEPWLDGVAVERLPGYTDFLRAAARRTRSGLTATDVEWAYRHVGTQYHELLGAAIDGWLAPVLTGLDPNQRRHLRERMRSENANYRERYIDVSRRESQRALADRIVRLIEGWTGPLDVQQTQLLHRGVRELPDTSLQWYHYRMRMQAGLLARLRGAAGEAEVAAWMRDWWVDRAALRPGERLAFERFRHELVALLAEFATTLTPNQRLSLGRRLRAIADELETIHFQTVRG